MSRRLLAPRSLLTSGAVLLAVAGGFALSSAISGAVASAGVVAQGKPSLVSYHGQATPTFTFTIAGNVSQALHPNKTSTIDLSFTNPSATAITLPLNAITITITSPKPATCPASTNFAVPKVTPTTTITIPPHATATSLSDMGIATKYWPRISMLTTTFNQDGCAGLTLTLTYSATVASTQPVTAATTSTGSGSGGSPPTTVPVNTPTAAASSGGLAFTGFDVLLFAGSGTLLIVVGLGLLIWRRRLDSLRYSDSAPGGDGNGD